MHDASVLVQREALDLLTSTISLDNVMFDARSMEQLMKSVLLLLAKREVSLSRHVVSW